MPSAGLKARHVCLASPPVPSRFAHVAPDDRRGAEHGKEAHFLI
jgi:hypothetical protein